MAVVLAVGVVRVRMEEVVVQRPELLEMRHWAVVHLRTRLAVGQQGM
jgi:hypothetical protein